MTDRHVTAATRLEMLRWPDGPECPRCEFKGAYRLKQNVSARIRSGLLVCRACRQQFTVTVNTVLEDAHMSPEQLVRAVTAMCDPVGSSSIKMRSAAGITQKSAHYFKAKVFRLIGVTAKRGWQGFNLSPRTVDGVLTVLLRTPRENKYDEGEQEWHRARAAHRTVADKLAREYGRKPSA